MHVGMGEKNEEENCWRLDEEWRSVEKERVKKRTMRGMQHFWTRRTFGDMFHRSTWLINQNNLQYFVIFTRVPGSLACFTLAFVCLLVPDVTYWLRKKLKTLIINGNLTCGKFNWFVFNFQKRVHGPKLVILTRDHLFSNICPKLSIFIYLASIQNFRTKLLIWMLFLINQSNNACHWEWQRSLVLSLYFNATPLLLCRKSSTAHFHTASTPQPHR